MNDKELYSKLEALGWRRESNGGNTHVMRKGALVLCGADGGMPSLHYFTLMVAPQWDIDADIEPQWQTVDISDQWKECEPRDLWEMIAVAEAFERAQSDDTKTIFQIIADGLDASTDGRGWDSEHEAARTLANAAPDPLAALKALRVAADDFLEHGKERHYVALHNAMIDAESVIAKAEGREL